MHRRLATFAAGTAMALAAAAPATAGGWATTVVDPFRPPKVGTPLEVSFAILQHGVTPVDVDGVLVVVTEPDGDLRRFAAEPAGEVGRYRATIDLAEAGQHTWLVVQGWFGEQDLGRLEVAAAPSSAEGFPTAVVATLAVVVAAVGTLAAAAVLVRRRRSVPVAGPAISRPA